MWTRISSLPRNTVIQCGVAAVISVFFISWLRIRPLGLFFLATFGLWYYKTRCNLRIVPPPELKKNLKQISEKMHDIRQTQPTMFCMISAGCLSALAIIGHLLSGSTVVLTGLVLAAILSTKYNFQIIKIEPKDFAWTDKINHDPEYDDDEFLPEVDERNQFVLERACDLASLSLPTDDIIMGNGDGDDDEKSDDIPSELLIPDPIPEIQDISSDDDDDDVNELVPIVKEKAIEAIMKNNNSQKDKNNVIEFKKGHFKRDSSLSTSSSEESLSKGLKFPDHTTVDGPALQRLQQTSNNQAANDLVAVAVKTHLANSSSKMIIPNLVSGLVQWGMSASGAGGGGSGPSQMAIAAPPPQRRIVTALDSSDESDFEILENEDFK